MATTILPAPSEGIAPVGAGDPFKFALATDFMEQYPGDWPPRQYYVDLLATDYLQDELRALVDARSAETEVDRFLREHPAILAASIRGTGFGHHGSWVIPQKAIRAPGTATERGLIPDYIVGGTSSDGFVWYVVELKGVNQTLFAHRKDGRLSLSPVANSGICQLLEYVDYCSAQQSYLRDAMKLTAFREPRGLLIIGHEQEFGTDIRRARMKASLNRALGGRIEVRTYGALLRGR